MVPAPKFSFEEQEEMILKAAEESIENSSLLDFPMSDIAKRAGLSMGSVYKHVQSKEDVLIALASRMYRNEYGVYERLLSLPLTIPERIVAVSLLHRTKTRTYSFESHLDNLVTCPDLLDRCSPGWLTRMRSGCEGMAALFRQLLVQGVEDGELLSGLEVVDEMNQAIWSYCAGYFQLVRQHQCQTLSPELQEQTGSLCAEALISPDALHIRGMKRFINAYEWREPLTCEGIGKACQALEAEGFR